MKKRALLTTAVIISGILVISFILWGVPVLKFSSEDKGIGTEIDKTDPLIKDAVLLDKLLKDESSRAEKKLIEMSSRKDAVGYYAALEIARRYSAKGEDPVPYYRKALDLYNSKSVSKMLASSLASQGKYEEAADIYASVLPDSDALDKLVNFNASPEVISDYMLKYSQWEIAEEYLKGVIANTANKDQILMLEKRYARALGEMGKYKDALPVLERLVSDNPSDNDTKWWYGRSLEALGQTQKAKQVYSSIGEAGTYRLGLILEKEGNIEDAANTFIKSGEPDSMWRGARLLDQLGKKDKALEIYLKLSREQGVYQDDAAYRAYILLSRNKEEGSDQVLELISKNPAWMSRLNKETAWETFTEVSYSEPEFLKRVDAYKKNGRIKMAEIEFFIGENTADIQGKLALGDWYLAQNDYYQAVRWGLRALKEQPAHRAYELAYQRPYDKYVLDASKEFDVDPNLIWSVMREESYFKEDAVSRVGAQGLMQIMPETGKYIASRLDTTLNDGDLLKASVNIRFGTYYLRSLLDKFSGDMDKALAAYNGGSGNVKKWSTSKIGTSSEDFPTAVTFLETREYITKVRKSYYIYKKLYGN